MRLLLEHRGDAVSLLPALARGGEGSIHPVLGEPGLVAKVFAGPAGERAEKLRAMIDNPPAVTANAPVLLAWPQDRLLSPAGECVGYVMPYAKGKETFFTVSQPGTRPAWAKDHGFRLRAAKNVAAAVSAFHRHGYVVGDINESNVLIGPDAAAAVVDTDSAQVPTPRRVFRCRVGKEGFTPPELIRLGGSYGDTDRHPHHDAFGLAVLVFQLLMDGNHPFSAQYLGTGTRPTLTERIAQGHWPHGKNRNSSYRPRRGAPPLESLHPELQRLMHECFEAGHKNPACRPTADEWCKALAEAEVEWDTPKARLRYFYHRLRSRERWGRGTLHALERLRPPAARVPRKVWAAVAGVTGSLLLAALCLGWPGWPGHPEPAHDRPDGSGITTEGTPRLWRTLQDPSLLPDDAESHPREPRNRGESAGTGRRDVQRPDQR